MGRRRGPICDRSGVGKADLEEGLDEFGVVGLGRLGNGSGI